MLRVHGLEIPVRIGLTEEERRIPQAIQFDIEIQFAEKPLACSSDKIEDSICYDEMSSQIEEKVSSRSYKLIEHLCQEVFTMLSEKLAAQTHLALRVKKLRPPLRQTNQGVSFELSGVLTK